MNKREVYLLVWVSFSVVIMAGMAFNFQVMVQNEGRMPVPSDTTLSGDFYLDEYPQYVFMGKDSNVKYKFLGDIFGVKDKIMFSIGDVFMTIGLIGSACCGILWGRVERKKYRGTQIPKP